MMTIRELEEHLKGYDKNLHCAWTLWLPDDVIDVARQDKVELSNEEISEILDDIHSHQSAEYGLSWESLRCAVQDHERVKHE